MESSKKFEGARGAVDYETVPILPPTGYVRERQLVTKKGRQGIIPFSPATLWRKVNSGEFPKPVKLSAGVTAWRVEDVRAWMALH